MLLPLCGALLALMGLPALTYSADSNPKRVVCFYNSRSFSKTEVGKYDKSDLETAAASCSHIVYGYAKVNAKTSKLEALDPELDLDTGKDNYKAITGLKKKYPQLKVLLSVGGWADTEDEDKYLNLLRDLNARYNFVTSAKAIVDQYGFDGVDLAWQFPYVRVKQRNRLSSIWHKIKKTFGYSKGSKDPLAEEHKRGFYLLVDQLNDAFKHNGQIVTASVIPHTNYTVYWDVEAVSPLLNAVHLHAFDFLTAERKIAPDLAYYPAPLYTDKVEDYDYNAHSMAKWFLDKHLPANKLIMGIPAYGRTWRITDKHIVGGYPPIEADGPGAEGYYTKEKGILSYPEICTALKDSLNYTTGVKKGPSDARSGTFAFRKETEHEEGLWVGYDDTEVVKSKAEYVNRWGLGGVSIHDVTMDDYKGVCGEGKFPLLNTAKQYVAITK